MTFSNTNQEFKINDKNFASVTLTTHYFKVAFLLLITVTLSSCSGDDDASNSENGNYALSAKIDGVDFSTNMVEPNVSAFADITPLYTITGIDDNGGRITILLQSPIQTGTFTTDEGETDLGPAVVLSYMAPNNDIFSGNDTDGPIGMVTITKNNENSVEGTFSFTGNSQQNDNTVVITQGEFKAKKL